MLAYNLTAWPDSKRKLFCHAGERPPGNQRRGKNLQALFLSSKWENVLILQQSSEVVLFFFPNSYFPAFMGRMLQAQGNAAVTPPFLSLNFCFRKCNYEAHEDVRSVSTDTHFRWREKRVYYFFFPLKKPYLLKSTGRVRTHHNPQQTPSEGRAH